jgi:hypothetical protein
MSIAEHLLRSDFLRLRIPGVATHSTRSKISNVGSFCRIGIVQRAAARPEMPVCECRERSVLLFTSTAHVLAKYVLVPVLIRFAGTPEFNEPTSKQRPRRPTVSVSSRATVFAQRMSESRIARLQPSPSPHSAKR